MASLGMWWGLAFKPRRLGSSVATRRGAALFCGCAVFHMSGSFAASCRAPSRALKR